MYALQIDRKRYGRRVGEMINLFRKENIEARPVWELNHLQKPYVNFYRYKIERANSMQDQTLNIPCSVNLDHQDIRKTVGLLKKFKKV